MSFSVEVAGGTSVRLPTAGKYCDRDIIVTATGGAGGDPALPSGYVRCGYIAFASEQIVDTGVICNQDTQIHIVFTRDSNDAVSMYGVASSGNTASVTAYLTTGGGNWRFGSKAVSRNIPVDERIIRNAFVSKTGIESEMTKNSISGVADFETIGTLLIGTARNTDGSLGSAQFVGKIFTFKIWQADELILDLVPVVSTDGRYRFWDAVGKEFYDSLTEVTLGGGNI